jgi:hypothetical protein
MIAMIVADAMERDPKNGPKNRIRNESSEVQQLSGAVP